MPRCATTPSARLRAALVLALLTAFQAAPAPGAADDKGILGDDLAELEKTVDSLPAAGERNEQKPQPPPSDKVTPPPPNSPGERTPMGNADPTDPKMKNGGDGTVIRPPLPPTGSDGQVGRPTVPGGGVIPPPRDDAQPLRPGGGGGAGGVAKGTIVRQEWEIERDSGVWFRNGLLVFDAPGENQSPTATLSRNVKGDFDLRVDYVITPTDDRRASGAAFGIRLDSRATETQLSVDRKIDPDEGDRVVVNEAGGIKPLLSIKPSGPAGAIRIRRRGARFQVAHGNADGSRWTEMGEVNVRLADEIQVWMVGFTDWAGARVTVHRADLAKPQP